MKATNLKAQEEMMKHLYDLISNVTWKYLFDRNRKKTPKIVGKILTSWRNSRKELRKFWYVLLAPVRAQCRNFFYIIIFTFIYLLYTSFSSIFSSPSLFLFTWFCLYLGLCALD